MNEMDACSHSNIVVVMEGLQRLRCRHCHLTLKPDELVHGYCPECYETDGRKRDDFEEIPDTGGNTPSYRCEDCGAALTPSNTLSR